jgi:hypothetical protein
LKEVKRLLAVEASMEDRGEIGWLRRDGAAVLSAENERKWGRSAVGSKGKDGWCLVGLKRVGERLRGEDLWEWGGSGLFWQR